ncbi:MAG TPA: LysR substrate-binding domain-containing protein [Gemmatimonadaceae bacterium]|jgi:DNA-binding transcriptional LysR family regulator|nr:LysR substrate-binding domain-containing protein [Gemmatimonadaceae bacterium]
MALNLHHLRIFARVAELGGFSRAAEALRLSQPAVSKSVRELERQLQTTLFDRAAGALRLTDAGAALLPRARELFAVERLAEEELRRLHGLEDGVLRIGASTTIATYLLPSYLARFRDAHPGVALRLTTANTRDVALALVERRVEVALVEGPVDDPRLRIVAWRDDELVLIAPPTHALARKRRVTPADLATVPFIARERGSGTRRVAEAALASQGISLRIALRLSSTEAIMRAVAAGLGVAIVSRAAIEDQLSLSRIVALKLRGLAFPRALSELRLAGGAESPAAAAFRAMLRAG